MGRTWDDSAHSKLLLAILSEVKLTNAQFENVATRLGSGLTGNAVRCHIKSLRREISKTKDGDSVPNSAENTPVKPSGNTAGNSRKSKSNTGKKRKRSLTPSEPGNSELSELVETPSPKRMKPQRRAAAKQAIYEDNEGDEEEEVA